jgi:hypothetical protein
MAKCGLDSAGIEASILKRFPDLAPESIASKLKPSQVPVGK